MPLLIFGAGATDRAISGTSSGGSPVFSWHRYACSRVPWRRSRRRRRCASRSNERKTDAMWTWFYRLASPPYVYRTAARAHALVLDGGGARPSATALIGGLGLRAARLSAGRCVSHHLRACAERLAVPVRPIPPWRWPAPSGSSGASRWAMRWRRRPRPSAPRSPCWPWSPARSGDGPMWGTYWAWDPRLTSELILLFLYVGVMSLRSAFEDPGARRPRGGAAGDRGRRQRAHHSLSRWCGGTHCIRGRRLLNSANPPCRAACSGRCCPCCLGFMLFLRRGAVHAAARRGAQSGAPGGVGAGGDQIVSAGGFWSMGGYARYRLAVLRVCACGVLAWNLWSARRYHAEARKRAQRALAMMRR